MHRLIEWVTDLIDDYGESFIEAPLKTLSKTVSWIFSIVIGVDVQYFHLQRVPQLHVQPCLLQF